MALPKFLCVGAGKSGTTSLHRMLREHPEIYIPGKDFNFFDVDYQYANGVTWYEYTYFKDAPPIN